MHSTNRPLQIMSSSARTRSCMILLIDLVPKPYYEHDKTKPAPYSHQHQLDLATQRLTLSTAGGYPLVPVLAVTTVVA